MPCDKRHNCCQLRGCWHCCQWHEWLSFPVDLCRFMVGPVKNCSDPVYVPWLWNVTRVAWPAKRMLQGRKRHNRELYDVYNESTVWVSALEIKRWRTAGRCVRWRAGTLFPTCFHIWLLLVTNSVDPGSHPGTTHVVTWLKMLLVFSAWHNSWLECWASPPHVSIALGLPPEACAVASENQLLTFPLKSPVLLIMLLMLKYIKKTV